MCVCFFFVFVLKVSSSLFICLVRNVGIRKGPLQLFPINKLLILNSFFASPLVLSIHSLCLNPKREFVSWVTEKMGGCATKPKVYKSEVTNEAPAPAPEPTKEEKAVGYAPYSKDKEVLLVSESENKPGETDYFETEKKYHKFEGGEFDQLIKEVVDVEDKGTDEQTKRRSLSNLFKEVI